MWRLNTSILNNPRFKTQKREEIKRFLEENDNGEFDSATVWDTFNAVIRGRIISCCAYEKKQKQLRLIDLNKELKNLETQHKREQKPELLTKIKAVRNKINLIYTQEVEKKMIFPRQAYYESGAKSLKILARKLQKQQADNAIYKIRDIDSKTIQYKQEEIQRTFRKYYKRLYTQPQLDGDQQIDDFLNLSIYHLHHKNKTKLEKINSVLNVDYKLYATILARRLDKVLPQLIHNDQTRFILQRQTHDNIRRSLHILHHIQKNNTEACLVSIDAEKAFDSVSWPFLYKVLERFGLDNIFIRGIRTLYNKPSV